MVKYSELNESQKEAVIDDSKHLRIIAGAGSGKTRVLTMRIVYLIEQKNVKPSNILAITFTNKAANEMKIRIKEMLKDKGNGAFISTIHSLCVRILKEEIEILGYPKNFTIVDADDQKSILKEAYKLYDIKKNDLAYSQALDYIANCKYEHLNPQESIKYTNGEPMSILKNKIYEYYDNKLKQLYALDFDDLILWTTKLFKLHSNVLEKWSKKFKYIHVDEFQDIDKEQYLLIKQLSSTHDNVYVVGDPDQTIFTWRGADVNIIVNFDKDFKDTKTIILNQNYRSTNNILEGANSVIKNNRARVPKELFSNNGDGEKIYHKTLMDEISEANYVVENLLATKKNNKNYSDCAILYRSNYLSREIEKVLVENKIPYVIYGGIRFYERAEVKDILSYLRLIVKGDDLAFERVINKPKRGIGNKTIDDIRALSISNHISMFEVIEKGLYSKNSNVLDGFVNMIHRFQDDMKSMQLDNLLAEILDSTGYRLMLEKDNETERLENVKSLIDDIKEYQELYPESTLDDYLQMIALYTDKESNDTSDAVKLMTVHSAKGLEFDTVYVIGLSEGIFPSERSLMEGTKGLEEERRLAYVAFTRAKQKLVLTDTASFSYVLSCAKLTSRFVNEIDENYIEHIDKPKDNKESLVFDTFVTDKIDKKTIDEYHNGDIIIHKIFGEGVLIDNDNGVLTIAFSHPHGVKKIVSSHPSIRKKTNNDYS